MAGDRDAPLPDRICAKGRHQRRYRARRVSGSGNAQAQTGSARNANEIVSTTASRSSSSARRMPKSTRHLLRARDANRQLGCIASPMPENRTSSRSAESGGPETTVITKLTEAGRKVGRTGDAPGPGSARARVVKGSQPDGQRGDEPAWIPSVVLITGISAAGKSTVAQALAERFARGVHVRGDMFRRLIVAGREDMSSESTEEAVNQLLLRYELMAATADTYAARGFTVVAQDVILGPVLDRVVAMFSTRPLGVVVLAPSAEAVRARERGRAKVGYHAFTPDELDASLRSETPPIGLWLDTSAQTPAETVDEILATDRPGGSGEMTQRFREALAAPERGQTPAVAGGVVDDIARRVRIHQLRRCRSRDRGRRGDRARAR